jgi:hypothetical protein
MPAHTIRTQQLVDTVLSRLAKGEPLAQIGRDDGMPEPSTWRDWCKADEFLAIAYAQAREDGFDAIALDALDIADHTAADTIKTENGDRPDNEWIARSRLRVDTRLKLLAKWDPNRYGHRTLIGSDPDNPLPSGVNVTFAKTD